VTVNDARAIKALLADPARCAYPDDDQHLRLLHDSTATKSAILDGLKWLKTCAEMDKDATIIVFYSGHGWLEEHTGKYYLIRHDVNPLRQVESGLGSEDFTDSPSCNSHQHADGVFWNVYCRWHTRLG